MRDPLSVDADVTALLPADDKCRGFDNMADVLGISPALMQGYIWAAGRISREAVGDPSALSLTNTYSISRVTSQTRHVPGTPFGTRGGMSLADSMRRETELLFSSIMREDRNVTDWPTADSTFVDELLAKPSGNCPSLWRRSYDNAESAARNFYATDHPADSGTIPRG